MDLDFSNEEVDFREEVRTWLAENAPRELRPRRGQAMRDFDMAWLRKRWEAGWAGIAWPEQYGGRSLSLTQQLIWYEEYALPTSEQQEICASAASFLAKELPISRIRELLNEPSTIDRTVWSHAAGLGWFVLGLPEELGGVGYGPVEEALLFREVGRHLATGPLIATVLGARLAARAGAGDLVASIGRGDTIVGLGLPRLESQVPVSIAERVSGEMDLIDTVDADLVLVAGSDGSALVESTRLADVTPAVCIDETTRLARGRTDNVSAIVYATAEVDDVFSRGALLATAMLAAIAEACRDQAVEYAKARVQFGQPIGAYQAVKHSCADMAIRAEAAASQLFFAALAFGSSPCHLSRVVHAAPPV
jgi:alkylation response protein AidB-like acyl-CoA dehydrogenase